MQKRRMDYHMHSFHSYDSRQSVSEAARAAVAAGIDEICLTEHMDLGHPTPDFNHAPDAAKWLCDIEKAREEFPNLLIRAGLEIGDIKETRSSTYEYLKALNLDFKLLSLHVVKGRDPYDANFFEGQTREDAYFDYVVAKLESAKNFADYDALAHLGYVGKFAPFPPETRPLALHDAKEAIDELLRHLANEGKALEINASGLRQTQSPIPGADIIKRFIEVGGEFFTFGSDAHTPIAVYQHVEKAKQIALDCGAKWQVGFEKRVMRVFKI